jgi:arylsulfatase A
MKTPISRRQFVSTAAVSIAAAPATARLLGANAPATQSAGSSRSPKGRRPNVILIMLDDLGSVDANCYGSKDLLTPNLDALAESGVRFTQLCSAAPLCSPSRAGVLTGRYPQRAGMSGNAGSQPGQGGMAADEITLARVLKSADYETAHVGKWHLGYTPQTMPMARGFDQSFGHMGGCIDNYSHYFYWDGPDRHDLWQDGRETWRDGQNIGQLMVEQCREFLRRPREKPFFLFWAINQPHYPLQGRAKWREHYKHLPSPRSMYAASVSTADELIGQVVAEVRALGLSEQTIIALQSDHGHSTEERTFGGGGSAGPYRGAKFSLFEGGIRVVSMVSWPGTLPRASVRDQFVTGCDWMPTLVELSGAPPPARRLDGKSMVQVIQSPTAASQHPAFHWQLGNQWAVRENNWKLIGNPLDPTHKAPLTKADKVFLSDLHADVTEMTNLAGKHPDQVRDMTALHERWVGEVKDRA